MRIRHISSDWRIRFPNELPCRIVREEIQPDLLDGYHTITMMVQYRRKWQALNLVINCDL